MDKHTMILWENEAQESFQNGIFLWIITSDAGQPEIGISKNGLFHALTIAHGVKEKTVQALLETIQQESLNAVVMKTSENSLRYQNPKTIFDEFATSTNCKSGLDPVIQLYMGEMIPINLALLIDRLLEAGVLELTYGINDYSTLKW